LKLSFIEFDVAEWTTIKIIKGVVTFSNVCCTLCVHASYSCEVLKMCVIEFDVAERTTIEIIKGVVTISNDCCTLCVHVSYFSKVLKHLKFFLIYNY
jgi:hypothetical protein